jgi:hypothetical protein
MDWTDPAHKWTGGGLLWMRWWIIGFHRMQEMCWFAANM